MSTHENAPTPPAPIAEAASTPEAAEALVAKFNTPPALPPDALPQVRAALERALSYICWSDDEGRSPEDYPEAVAIINADRAAVQQAIAALATLSQANAPLRPRPAVTARIKPDHAAADAFWAYWRENGETHKHGYYESTWGAINAALAVAGQAATPAPVTAPRIEANPLHRYVTDPRNDGSYELHLGPEETRKLWDELDRLIPRSAPVTADGVALIAAERARQVLREGWTPEHDDEHAEGELAKAAAVYALPDDERDYQRHLDPSENGGRDVVWKQPALWPWDPEWFKPTPDDRIRELVKAGALIAAEIDRLRRTGGAR